MIPSTGYFIIIGHSFSINPRYCDNTNPPPSQLSVTFPIYKPCSSFRTVFSGRGYFEEVSKGKILLRTIPVKQDLETIYWPKQHPFRKAKPLKRSALNMKGSLLAILLLDDIPTVLVNFLQFYYVVISFSPLKSNPSYPHMILIPRKEKRGSMKARLLYYPSSTPEQFFYPKLIRFPASFLIWVFCSFYFQLMKKLLYPANSFGFSDSLPKFIIATFFFQVYFFKCSVIMDALSESTSTQSSSFFAITFPFSKILGLMMKASETILPLGFRNRVYKAILFWLLPFLEGFSNQMLLVMSP